MKSCNAGEDYKKLRQEVKHDLMQLYPGAVMLTLRQVMQVYGYKDRKVALAKIGAKRITGEKRVMYYLGDVASDIARRRCGNTERK